MPLMTENMLFLYAMGLGLALLVIGALIKPIIEKLRDRPPPVAAIIIMAAAVFAGWALVVVSVPKTQRANTYEHAELWAVPPGEPVQIDRFGRPLLPKKPSKYLPCGSE